jgi:cytochrome oxidase Cu insertion factor (SCO1/SenC/PrrC family)
VSHVTSLFPHRQLVLGTALLALLTARPLLAQVGGIPLGTQAPSAMVETMDGAPIDLASYAGKGKPVVLEFWATWCPLCRRLEPAMQAARTTYADRVTFVSVGVAANQTPERQRAHAQANKMTGEFVFDRNDAAQKAYTVLHTSYVVVLDAKGVVVYTGMGDAQDIDAAVQKGLGGMTMR